MPLIDNFDKVSSFVPETFDGDTFLYTELLNRNRKSGNNKGRLVHTFYHRDRGELLKQRADIISWCQYTGARAMTRLGPRSFKKVGQYYAKHIVEQALAGNWEGMRHGYNHACGKSSPVVKYWLWDFDGVSVEPPMAEELRRVERENFSPVFVAKIPSRTGFHMITHPFDVRILSCPVPPDTLHKDNPTNLYIPE